MPRSGLIAGGRGGGSDAAGRHIAMRLVAEGEKIVEVPANCRPGPGIRQRAGPQTDAWDAHSVALVGTRTSGLHLIVDDEQRTLLQILVDRRRALGEDHTRMTSQLHVLLLELIPGGAKKDLSAAQPKKLLATVRTRDAAGKARRRVAAELVGDLERFCRRRKAANKELDQCQHGLVELVHRRRTTDAGLSDGL